MSTTTFLRDAEADRSIARLRLAGAIVVGVSSAALALGGGGSLRWLLVALGLLASLGWLAAYSRSRRSPGSDDRLELGADGLTMTYRGKTQHLEWRALTHVEADEERLVVRVEAGQQKIEVPLIWKGAGLHELAASIADAQNRFMP